MDIQITVDEFQAKIENQDFCWLIVSQMHQFRFNGFFQIHGDFAAHCMYRNMMFAAKLCIAGQKQEIAKGNPKN